MIFERHSNRLTNELTYKETHMIRKKTLWLMWLCCLLPLYVQCQTEQVHPTPIADEGAWCWFADPRALHHESRDGRINKSYVGYIDRHGNIKAMQYDFRTGQQEEILIRSYFQPDDHNNPTFLVLPDERVMVFYSRHTDEPCFYYRITRLPGDLTTLGKEQVIATENNTTYPSPFLLSDDPTHIYLCWRGIGWHPTIARLTLPDADDRVQVDWGPFQLVQSTGARPYAKYVSNGKDKIYLSYTTGHPDNEYPNFLYLNVVDIRRGCLTDIRGNVLSTIADGPLAVDKRADYGERFPWALVDASTERDWVWQVALDGEERPVIAMTRISEDKASHDYYYARWTGNEWKKSWVAHGGGHFHRTTGLELCYSGGMAIDPADVHQLYASVPVEGHFGKVYEIVKYTLDDEGRVTSTEPLTTHSTKDNARPFVLPGSEGTPLRVVWMQGDYYDWIVSRDHPLGYNTGIYSDFAGFADSTQALHYSDETLAFHPDRPFAIELTLTPDTANYGGCLLQLGNLSYHLDARTLKPEVRYQGQRFVSTNVLGTADSWQQQPRGTNGDWYAPQRFTRFRLKLVYADGQLSTYINDALDQRITLVEAAPLSEAKWPTCLVEAGKGYSQTSVNTTVFRNSSLLTRGKWQYIAYYDAEGYLTLGKRKLDHNEWTLHRTQYRGNVKDAHNVISMMMDGEGYLHLSFDHHGHPLNYCRSLKPYSLELGDKQPMTEVDEGNVTYPEFYLLAGGDLLFAYRSGSSGRGNLVLNRYILKEHKWVRVQDVLIDGEEKRNAYWQFYVDERGTIHLSWVWRETWMVETNHDLCYACSYDNGVTWQKSNGEVYELPIKASNAEYACRIPQNSELINQTSMSADAEGHPYIATYWRSRESDVPQYRLVWFDGRSWKQSQVSQRTTPFSLKGGGTKMIPIARPRIVVDGKEAFYIFRDEERGSKVSMAHTDDIDGGVWTLSDLTDFPVDAWEPSHDTELWKSQKRLHIFVQHTKQGDGERTVAFEAQPVYVLEVLSR